MVVESDYPRLYHGTEGLSLVGILRSGKLRPVMEQEEEAQRENSNFRKSDYDKIVRLLDLPSLLITPNGGKRTIKQILKDEGIVLTRENYESLRPRLVELEVQEGLRGLRESPERQRYENVWFTSNQSKAKSYAPGGILLSFQIPQEIWDKAKLIGGKYVVAFPFAISLDYLKEVIYWDRNRKQLSKLQEDFKKWNPLFLEYGK